jgi:hypothetical protein
MQSEKNYKCGNCGTIVEERIFSTLDSRHNCPTCGPLCEECVDGVGIIFSSPECKGCGNSKLNSEKFRAGEWE